MLLKAATAVALAFAGQPALHPRGKDLELSSSRQSQTSLTFLYLVPMEVEDKTPRKELALLVG